MNAEKRLAMDLLDAVWKEDVQGVENCLELGASPSWVFNGYPILMHAISIGNEEIVNILIDAGAIQKQEALGFALERGIGQMIRPLVFRGIVPKHFEPKKGFGYYPQRFCSTHYKEIKNESNKSMHSHVTTIKGKRENEHNTACDRT